MQISPKHTDVFAWVVCSTPGNQSCATVQLLKACRGEHQTMVQDTAAPTQADPSSVRSSPALVSLVQTCSGRVWYLLDARLPAPPIPESAPGQVGLGRPRKPLPAAVPSFREAKDWHNAHGDCLPLHLPLALPGRTLEAQPPPTAQHA